jgi:outer membrane cobalamin receptor
MMDKVRMWLAFGMAWLCLTPLMDTALGQDAPGPLGGPPDTTHAGEAGVFAGAAWDSLAAAEGDTAAFPVVGPPKGLDRLTAGVEVFTKSDMQEIASVSPAEVLVLDPGAHIQVFGTYGSPQLLRLRLGKPGDIAYLLDGVPISDSRLETFDLTWLPLKGVSEVELAKGGLASSFGSGSGSGAVNLVSADAMVRIPRTEAGVWWGGYDSRSIDLAFRRMIANRVGILGTYENTRSGGWVTNSSYQGQSFLGKLSTYIWGNLRMEITGFKREGDIELPDSCSHLFISGLKRTSTRSFTRISLAGGTESAFRLDYHRLSISQEENAGTVLSSDRRMEGVNLGWAGKVIGDADGSLDAGFRTREIKSDLTGNMSSALLYLSAGGRLGSERAWLRGDLRIEWDSELSTEAAPSLTGRYAPGGRWAVFGRLDRSFRYPTFPEIVDNGRLQPGDPEPGTEHSLGAEFGATYDLRMLRLGVTAFWRKADDMICWEADETCERLRSTDSGLTIAGVEISSSIVHPWGLKASVSFAPARAEGESGNELLSLPTGILTWDVGVARHVSRHVALGMRFTGRRVSSVDTGSQFTICTGEALCSDDTELPAYTSAMLYGYVAIDRARVFGRITNLFRATIYPEWGDPSLPSRSYEIGTSWELWD